jgi:hypothetical protein
VLLRRLLGGREGGDDEVLWLRSMECSRCRVGSRIGQLRMRRLRRNERRVSRLLELGGSGIIVGMGFLLACRSAA